MKRLTAILMGAILILSMAGCSTAKNFQNIFPESTEEDSSSDAVSEESLKIGFLFPGDTSAPDTKSRMEGIEKMQYATGLQDSQIEVKTSVKLDNLEKNTEKLISSGCNLIFSANSAFEEAIIELAASHPDVQFCQEGGSETATDNYHTYYTRIYEAYYVAGIVAGMDLNQRLNSGDINPGECLVGFVAQKKNAENTSCFTAFFLGIQKVCTQASMEVRYTGSKGVYDDDAECARQLIERGAVLLGERTCTNAVAVICAETGTSLVGNDYNMIATAPNNALTSAASDWSVYYTEVVEALTAGNEIPADWIGGYAEGANIITQLNDSVVAEGTAERVAKLEDNLRSSRSKVFDITGFTIDAESLNSLAETNSAYKKYANLIKNGEYKESSRQSAPTFDLIVDGISETELEKVTTEDTEETTEDEEQ